MRKHDIQLRRSTGRPYSLKARRCGIGNVKEENAVAKSYSKTIYLYVSFSYNIELTYWVNIIIFFFSYIYVLNYIFLKCFLPSKFFLNFYNFYIIWIQSIFWRLIVFNFDKFIISLNYTSDRIIITYFSF